jgi:hypothetical protein
MEDFLKLMAENTGKTIIFSNQGKKLPPYPFITFTSISKDTKGLSYYTSELTEDTLDIDEVLYKNIQEVIQMDFYHNTHSDCRDLAKEFINGLDFTYRQIINDAEFGIINIGNILDNTKLEQVKALYRVTCDVTIDYTEVVERTTANMQSIAYTGINKDTKEEVTGTTER